MARQIKGVYLNQPAAKCSIFESGQMVYKALQHSDRFSLEYFELEPATATKIPPADFYLFNYHHATMAWLDTKSLSALPGKKITVVLEMLPGNPFVYVSPNDFDAYLVLDPTMNIENAKVYGFPRPLEELSAAPAYIEKDIPWIGTFGFSTPGKGFELVVDAVNREFDRAVVRINIPPGTFADDHAFRMHKRIYAEYLTELCTKVAKPGIEVRVSREFMSKEQLIKWCAQNTLNCFLYARNQPGLSATTDQCITTGRPLAVSANETFRHLHQFIKPYPEMSLRESIRSSTEGVLQMQKEWTPKNFSLRMERVLSDLQLLDLDSSARKFSVQPPKPTRALLVSGANSAPELKLLAQQCANALGRLAKFHVTSTVCSSASELRSALSDSKAERVVFVWDKDQFQWLSNELLADASADYFALVHGGNNEGIDRLVNLKKLYMSPTDERESLPRVLPLNCNELPIQDIPTFAVPLLEQVPERASQAVAQVQAQFEQANIIFYVPGASPALEATIRAQILKPGIGASFVYETFSQDKLFAMLGFASLTLFVQATASELIILDHALSSQRPVGILGKGATDHLRSIIPQSFLDRSSLPEILAQGIATLVPLYNDWSEARFVRAFEAATCFKSQQTKTNTHRLNRVISSSQKTEYLAALEALSKLASELVAQTQPEKIIVHAFVLDTVEHFAKERPNARILGIETKSDPAVQSLLKLGYPVEEIDSAINFTLDQFYHMPTTAYQSYDIIFASTALDHTDDPEMFLAQVGDLLAPGGVAVLACTFSQETADKSVGTRHAAGNFRVFHEEDFRERFLPILSGCQWADAPSWKVPQNEEPATYATLVIAKSASVS